MGCGAALVSCRAHVTLLWRFCWALVDLLRCYCDALVKYRPVVSRNNTGFAFLITLTDYGSDIACHAIVRLTKNVPRNNPQLPTTTATTK